MMTNSAALAATRMAAIGKLRADCERAISAIGYKYDEPECSQRQNAMRDQIAYWDAIALEVEPQAGFLYYAHPVEAARRAVKAKK